MDHPRILFLTRKFPPSRGGMETFSSEITSRYPGPSQVIHYGRRQLDIIWAAPCLLLAALRRRGQVDLVHLGDLVLAPLAPWIKRWLGVPVVATAHALELTYSNRLLRSLINRALPALDHIVAVSDFTQELILARGVPAGRTSVITHGVTPVPATNRTQARLTLNNALQLTGDDAIRPLLLTVGRLVKRKGVAWCISTVLDRLKGNPLYIVAGGGSEQADLEAMIASRPNVRLLGRVSDTLLAQLYAGADIFVMPNIDVAGDAEGFGFVATEAAAYGLPVVAARAEGIPSAIHDNQNGRLVTPGVADEFATIINQWLGAAAERQAFGEAARTYTTEHFSWDARVRQYQKLFESLTRP